MSADLKIQGKPGFQFTNWAKTYNCSPELYFEPKNRDELRQILSMARSNNRKVRVIGKGHSPSDLACTTDYMISMKRFNTILNVHASKKQVTAEGGIVITDMIKVLDDNNLAFPVLGSISDLTLAGAISTGTHGTGIDFGIISSNVLEMEIMTASGDVQILHRSDDSDEFHAACLSLGAMGIILSVTLQCESAFNLQRTTYGVLFDDIIEYLPVHIRASEHCKIKWYPLDYCVVEHLRRIDKAINVQRSFFWDTFVGYYLLEFLLLICSYLPFLTIILNKIYFKYVFSQPTKSVDVSHKMFNIECLFSQFVMEWSVPVEKAALVLTELKTWLENSKFPAHFPIEIRFVKGDKSFLSPAHSQDSCYVGIISYRPYGKAVAKDEYWQAFQSLMKNAGGRPHWAKDHSITSEQFKDMYPKWSKFHEIRKKYDPHGMFMNANLERVFN